MSKTKSITKTEGKQRPTSGDQLSSFDLDQILDKYIWLLLPILILLYYWFSTGSTGFYQDDEIGHYRNIRQFWSEPFSIMGNQPKPGWKILMVLPGLFGFSGVAIAHAAIAALTVAFTYKLGRTLKLKNSSVAALFLASQPLFLQLSFRSYSEITAGLFVVLMILFYYREQYVFAALTSSYIFSIRQEFALVSIGLGALFLMKRKWLPLLLLAWTPVVLALIGWMHTGTMMWLIDDMRRIGLGVEVPHKPFWHYFETYIYIVGPVTLSLFMVGYWSFLVPPRKIKENLTRYGFLLFTFTIMWVWAVVSAWDVPNFGANPGHWRYLLSIAPLTAIYAGVGVNKMFELKSRRFVYIALGLFAVLTFLFLSKEANGLITTDVASYTNALIVFAVLLLYTTFASGRILSGNVFIFFILALGIGHTIYAEKPRKLDSEAQTVKDAANWYQQQPEAFQKEPLFGNHVLFRYFSNIDINDTNRDRRMDKVTLDAAPVGAVILWDSHYGNSQFGGDVPMEWFQTRPEFRLLQQFVNPERSFGVLVFEKEAL